jgi:hypothetical protein
MNEKEMLKKEKIEIDKRWEKAYNAFLNCEISKEEILFLVNIHNKLCKKIIEKGYSNIL